MTPDKTTMAVSILLNLFFFASASAPAEILKTKPSKLNLNESSHTTTTAPYTNTSEANLFNVDTNHNPMITSSTKARTKPTNSSNTTPSSTTANEDNTLTLPDTNGNEFNNKNEININVSDLLWFFCGFAVFCSVFAVFCCIFAVFLFQKVQ